jgi:RNA-binding protein YlmH
MLEHYNKSDHDFIIKAKDWLRQAANKHKVKTTGFLNPHEQQILKQLAAGGSGVGIGYEGGFSDAERRRAVLFPDYLDETDLVPEVSGFCISLKGKDSALEHRQILGSLMGLKIDRSRIGDIVCLPDGSAYVAVCGEFSDFVSEHFTAVGREPIRLAPADLSRIAKETALEERDVIVASLRLDVLVSALTNATRSQVADAIKQGEVQLNHSVVNNHSKVCQVGDLISIKRFGRHRLLAQKKVTKSGKLVMVIGKTVS